MKRANYRRYRIDRASVREQPLEHSIRSSKPETWCAGGKRGLRRSLSPDPHGPNYRGSTPITAWALAAGVLGDTQTGTAMSAITAQNASRPASGEIDVLLSQFDETFLRAVTLGPAAGPVQFLCGQDCREEERRGVKD